MFADLNRLEHLALANVSLNESDQVFASCARSVRTLKLSWIEDFTSTFGWFEGRTKREQFFHHLSDLSIQVSTNRGGFLPFSMIAQGPFDVPPCLRRLNLDIGAFNGADLERLLANTRLVPLKVLHLHGSRVVQDCHVLGLTKNMPHLEELGLIGSRMTGVGLKELLLKLKGLKRLDLTDCQDVGQDAVQWTRQQGVNVRYQLTQV